MWLYFPVAVARNIFGAPDQSSPIYEAGAQWAGVCFGAYSAVCFVASFVLPPLAQRIGRRMTHSLCLACGAVGLLSVGVIQNKDLLLLSMTGVGIAWASILSMPYAILAGALPPNKTGVFMGIFNFFIVIPQILAASILGSMVRHLFDGNTMNALIAGGVSMMIAATMVVFVRDVDDIR
jgi:maltose/moltooligosaccharide transporter